MVTPTLRYSNSIQSGQVPTPYNCVQNKAPYTETKKPLLNAMTLFAFRVSILGTIFNHVLSLL